jgi:mono/diheme cytochrome c family protein
MKRTIWTLAMLTALSCVSLFGADAKAGQAGYDKSCKGCHGAAGIPSPAMAKAMSVPDLTSAAVLGKSDADLVKAVKEGKGKMKAVTTLAGSPEDVIAYVRTFKK